tara:strand:+ start:8342 stop:10138 length:1797 start_codon:yes stop_codon:yes gene_type:complete
MCGISGIFNFKKKFINQQLIVQKIVKFQNRRGPDKSGIWESQCEKVIFGHNRLSIIELSNKGDQPFISLDQNLVITYNGEIYNFKDLKKELIENKVKFKSNSDTEVIIEGYKFWGLDFLQKLRGMFAFAIWDKKNQKLILARDPFGIKPLYYINYNNVFYFASQIKSLLLINDIKFNISNAGLLSYYSWGNLQEPLTLYKEIKSLEKGTCYVIDNTLNIKKINYANLKQEILSTDSMNFKNEKDKFLYLKDAIKETVNLHNISDVPRAVLLSSGIDSNVILNAMSDKDKLNCSALTLDFKYTKQFNETELAKENSKINNINHLINNINPKEFSKLIEHFYEDMDSPTNDGFNTYLISYLSKKYNFKVILSGIGGDELFFSYPSFKVIPRLNKLMQFIPKISVIDYFMKRNLYSFLKKNKFKTKLAGIYDYGRDLNSSFMLLRSLFLPYEIREFLNETELNEANEEINHMKISMNEISDFKDDRISIMYLEMKYYLCSKLLRDADWTSMSHSVELRTPFVDWHFFKKVLPFLKSREEFSKSILLDSFPNSITKKLKKRKKTGFMIPYQSYLDKLNVKKKYSNPIRDWSLYSLKKYLRIN